MAAAPKAQTVLVPQDDGQIVVTMPDRTRTVLDVTDGQVTVADPAVAEELLRTLTGAYRPEDAPPTFDPAYHSVSEVNAYLDEHPDDTGRVLEIEREERTEVPAAKQQRTGVLTGPHGDNDGSTDPAAEPAE